MRYTVLAVALSGAAFLTGCSSLVSLNSFVSSGVSAQDTLLTGNWKGADKDLLVIEQNSDDYTVHYYSGNAAPALFQAQLVRMGNAELLDVMAQKDDGFSVPAHCLVRVWSSQTTLQWAFLESDWLKQQIKPLLATQPSGDRMLITAPPDSIWPVVQKFATDDRAFAKQEVFTRAQ
jgi:hypothetical protein